MCLAFYIQRYVSFNLIKAFNLFSCTLEIKHRNINFDINSATKILYNLLYISNIILNCNKMQTSKWDIKNHNVFFSIKQMKYF